MQAERCCLPSGVISALLWIVDSFIEFVWFNEAGRLFGYFLLPLGDIHEMYMRGMLVSSLLVSGAVVSFMYGRVARIRHN